MDNADLQRMRELIDQLNRYRHAYYISQSPEVSDAEYDKLYGELSGLQTKLNIYMANSPVMYPGYPPVDKLEGSQHTGYPMNVRKTSEIRELLDFQMQNQLMLMPYLKGISVKIVYEDCQLKEITTFGENGAGYVITHNACSIQDLPIMFERKDRLVVSGRLVMNISTFEKLRRSMLSGQARPYSDIYRMVFDAVHIRNSRLCEKCKVKLLVTEVLEGMENISTKAQRLAMLTQYGFVTCRYLVTNRPLNLQQMEQGIYMLRSECQKEEIPECGALIMYNNAKLADLCGQAGYSESDRILWTDFSVRQGSGKVA